MSLANLKAGIRNALKDDVTLKSAAGTSTDFVFDKIAPAAAVYPFIIVHVQAWEDEYTLSARAYIGYTVEITCWDTERSGALDSATATSMADRIDALLTNQAIAVTGKTVRYIRRVSGADALEYDDEGTGYIGISAIYAIELQ